MNADLIERLKAEVREKLRAWVMSPKFDSRDHVKQAIDISFEILTAEIASMREKLAKVDGAVEDEPEESVDDTWRRLALQFDADRIRAKTWLKSIIDYLPSLQYMELDAYLAEAPMDGESVLAERIAALTRPSLRDATDTATVEKLTAERDRYAATLIRAWNAFGPPDKPLPPVVEDASDLEDIAHLAAGDLDEQIRALETALAEQSAHNAALREALEPFSEFAGYLFSKNALDGDVIALTRVSTEFGAAVASVTFAAFRAARKALTMAAPEALQAHDKRIEREALERAAAALEGADGKIPLLSAFAPLVSGNNMPDMSGDPRARLHAHSRRQFDSASHAVASAIRDLADEVGT